MSQDQTTINEALEQVRCAQINFDNLAAQMPVIKRSPFYAIVKMQLESAEAVLKGEK
jgi:hypothetical protein